MEEETSEFVDAVCHRCRIQLELLDAPVPRAAWWRFLDDHAYHPVELLWEHSEARDRIGIDYIVVDSDIKGDPSFAEYAGDWPGRPLALHPRPTARAVAEIVERAFDAMNAHKWQAAPADEVAAERLMQYMDFAPPASDLVGDTTVLARLAAVEAALEQLRQVSGEPVGEHFGMFLNDVLRALPTAADLSPDELRTESGPLASPRLWDAERALRLIQHLVAARIALPQTGS